MNKYLFIIYIKFNFLYKSIFGTFFQAQLVPFFKPSTFFQAQLVPFFKLGTLFQAQINFFPIFLFFYFLYGYFGNIE